VSGAIREKNMSIFEQKLHTPISNLINVITQPVLSFIYKLLCCWYWVLSSIIKFIIQWASKLFWLQKGSRQKFSRV